MRKVRYICVILNYRVRKLLQIRRLQNVLYGRLSRRLKRQSLIQPPDRSRTGIDALAFFH
jgi:hypothetical protein